MIPKIFIFSWVACHLLYVNLCCCKFRKWLYLNSDYGVSETQTITFSPISQGDHSVVSTIEYLCLLNSSPLWLILFFGGDSRCSTLRRWKDGKQMDIWEAHKAPIQAVLKLPSGELVTGIDSTSSIIIDFMCDHEGFYFSDHILTHFFVLISILKASSFC